MEEKDIKLLENKNWKSNNLKELLRYIGYALYNKKVNYCNKKLIAGN